MSTVEEYSDEFAAIHLNVMASLVGTTPAREMHRRALLALGNTFARSVEMTVSLPGHAECKVSELAAAAAGFAPIWLASMEELIRLDVEAGRLGRG
jgi:hypothetical protein